MTNKILHLVVRFSDNLFSVGDVVAKHNEIVRSDGYVWFGKMGSTLSENRVKILNEQIEKGVSTFVYLVKGNRKKSIPYRARLLRIEKELPEGEMDFIPAYYSEKGIMQYMKAWLKIGEILEIELSSMSNLRTINSVFSIRETLIRSSSGYFLVYEAKEVF